MAWRERTEEVERVEEAEVRDEAKLMRKVERAESSPRRPPGSALEELAATRRYLVGTLASLPAGRLRMMYAPRIANALAAVCRTEHEIAQTQDTSSGGSWLDSMRQARAAGDTRRGWR